MRHNLFYRRCIVSMLSSITILVAHVRAEGSRHIPLSAVSDVIITRTSAQVSGSVWVDSNCDGIKNNELLLSLDDAYIILMVDAGSDGVFNKGDGALIYKPDVNGVWKSGQVPIEFLDNNFLYKPITYGIAVGAATARGWGYVPSPPGGDSILGPAPQYISAGFTLTDGEQKQVGPIGLCPVQTRILLPRVSR